MKVYGYIRISSANQRIDRQMIDLQAYNVPKESIFIDKKSGKNFDRPSYQALIKKLRRGDLLYIKSIDRLGRNADEVQQQWKFLTKEKKIDIFVIDTPCLDTRAKADFLREFINSLFLYVLSFIAENERTVSRKRQAEGIKAAKQRGVRFGRARTPLPENFMEYCDLYLAHKLTVREAAEQCGLAKSTFADAVKRVLEEREQKESAKTALESTEEITEPSEESTKLTSPAPEENDRSVSEDETDEINEAEALETSRQISAPQSNEWKNNWTKILTFTPKAEDIPFSGIKEADKSASQSRKKSRKRKKTGRK